MLKPYDIIKHNKFEEVFFMKKLYVMMVLLVCFSGGGGLVWRNHL
jgi:hypothetical protein